MKKLLLIAAYVAGCCIVFSIPYVMLLKMAKHTGAEKLPVPKQLPYPK